MHIIANVTLQVYTYYTNSFKGNDMKERIVKYCAQCGYELRESGTKDASTYFSYVFTCPVCDNDDALHLLWVDLRNVDVRCGE
jgi:hypothetical protein